jgi:hypothetical protein
MKRTFLLLALLLSLNEAQAMQQKKPKTIQKAAPSKSQIQQKTSTQASNQASKKPETANPVAAKAPEKTTVKPVSAKDTAKSNEGSKPKAKPDIIAKKDGAKIDTKKSAKKRSSITAILPNKEEITVFGNQIYVAKKDAKGVFIKTIDENGKFKNFYDKNLIEGKKYRVRAKKNENVKVDSTKVVPIGHQKLATGEKESLFLVMQKKKSEI